MEFVNIFILQTMHVKFTQHMQGLYIKYAIQAINTAVIEQVVIYGYIKVLRRYAISFTATQHFMGNKWSKNKTEY